MKRSNFVPVIICFIAGLALTSAGYLRLTTGGERLKHHQNPFAIRKSGYGKTLARLSQETVDRVWHLGIEQVNPIGHDHGHGGGHDHGHDELGHNHAGDHDRDHEGSDRAHEMTENPDGIPSESGEDLVPLSDKDKGLLAEAGIDEDSLHCPDCRKLVLESLRNSQPTTQEDVLAIHEFHSMPEVTVSGGHDHGSCDHDHGHCDHDHSDEEMEERSLLTQAKEWMRDLTASRYERTSPFGMNDAHKKAVAADIENMLLRSYKMDPTDYGVYNAYFLFLTIHEFRSTPAARGHARVVSRLTIAEAMKEDTDPQPWLTAAMAWLNLFFMEQEDRKANGEEVAAEILEEFKQQMTFCLHRYALLREQAMLDGRWDLISESRRDAMEERQRFSHRTLEQFDTLLARATRSNRVKESAKNETGSPELKLGENGTSEQSEEE